MATHFNVNIKCKYWWRITTSGKFVCTFIVVFVLFIFPCLVGLNS